MPGLQEKFNLQDDFAETSYEEWKQLAEKDLEGIPLERLKTRTYEGIYLQFIYTKKDIQNLPQIYNKPGFKNFLRGTKSDGFINQPWLIAQEIPYILPEELNKALRTDLQKGQNAINIILNGASQKFLESEDLNEKEISQKGVYIQSVDDISKLFEGIDITNYPLFVNCGYTNSVFLSLLISYANKNKIDFKKFSGAIESDPYNFALREGGLPYRAKYIFDEMAFVTKWAIKNIPNIRTIGVSSLQYHNAGANNVQELAFAFASAVEYIREMLDRGLMIDEVAQRIRFTFGIGSLYFLQVAKYRAARLLWSKIIETFGGNEESQKINIHARTSSYNQTVFDPYLNMLRATTETFSAVVGGADSIHSNFFDGAIKSPDEFSRRIARNTQIILNDETHLNRIIDPAGGSYFIESLTDETAKKSYKLFQEIEEKGGMCKALKEGIPQNMVEKIDLEKRNNFSKRRYVLVGTNIYVNMKEKKSEPETNDSIKTLKKNSKEYKKNRDEDKIKKLLNKLSEQNNSENSFPIAIDAASYGATMKELANVLHKDYSVQVKIKSLKTHRISELFEELRFASFEFENKNGFLPKVLLLPMGPLAQNKARADFSRSFFEIGGFNVISKQRFHTTEAAIDAGIKSDSKIIVICSTDDTYPYLVPKITKGIKEKRNDALIVLAGYPKHHVEEFKNAGVDEFIFLGADVYEILKSIMKRTGVIQ